MDVVAGVTTDWIYLHKKQLAVDGGNSWGFSKDIDGKIQTFDVNAKDLEGSYHVTMHSQAYFAMNKDMSLQKKMEAYNMFKDSLTDEQKKRHMKSIYRDMGMNPVEMLPDEEAIKPAPTGQASPLD